MIKVRNKSNLELNLTFVKEESPYSTFSENLKPGEFIFLTSNSLTKPLIIQQRKDNISIEEISSLPKHTELNKKYAFMPIHPKIKEAIVEIDRVGILEHLQEKEIVEEIKQPEENIKIKEELIENKEEVNEIEQQKNEELNITQEYAIPTKSKGGRPKGAKNKKKKKKKNKLKKQVSNKEISNTGEVKNSENTTIKNSEENDLSIDFPLF